MTKHWLHRGFQPRYKVSPEGAVSLVDSSELFKTRMVKHQLKTIARLKKEGKLP